MTKDQIKAGAKKAVREHADIWICNSVQWLDEYGLIDLKTRCAIYAAIEEARNAVPEDLWYVVCKGEIVYKGTEQECADIIGKELVREFELYPASGKC